MKTTLPRRMSRGVWVAAVAGTAVIAVDASLNAAMYAVPVAAALAVALFRALALVGAVRRPRASAVALPVVATAFAGLTAGGGDAPWPWSVMGLITTALTAAALVWVARLRLAAASVLLAIACTVVVMLLSTGHDRGSATTNLLVAGPVLGGVLALAALAERWRRTRRQLERATALTEEEHAARLVAEERTRIARELHDVIAHSMSVINIQALSAPARHPDASPALRAEFEQIASGARRALGEMRELLGVLRADGEAETSPRAGLSELPDLVSQAQQAGAGVSFADESTADAGRVPDLVGLAIYRITQEGVSNALRHAPGAAVAVRLRVDEGSVRVSVHNGPPDGSLPADESRGGGNGLAGVRERVTRLGGRMQSAPHGDGFRLSAELPYTPRETSEEGGART